MGGRRTVAARCRRSLVAAACSGLVAVAALATGSPPASGSSLHPGSARTDFEPRSVTFVSLDTGWVLGTAPCAAGGRCLALEETIDAGRYWSARPLPTALLAAADRKVDGVPAELAPCCGGLNIRFANRRDGWIYGGLTVAGRLAGSTEPILWSTHDGGEVWRQQALPGLSDESPIFDVEAAGGMVYLMAPNDAEGVTVESSPVSEDSWHVSNAVRLGDPAGGSMQSGAFVLHGSRGWLVEGNDRGTTGSAELASDGRWVGWTPPCASVGHTFAIPAASTSSDLVAICVMGGFAYPLSRSAPPGATVGSSWLYFSRNGGRTFEAGPELGTQANFGFDGILASPSPGVILIGRYVADGQVLAASFDGGDQWTEFYRGQPLFLGFTSSSQGVGIVQSSNGATTMIMTFDGGHHWVPVVF